MPSDTAERTYTAEEIEALRQQVRALIGPKAEYKTKADAARDADIPYGTFAPWVEGNYPGNQSNVAAAVERWLSGREMRRTLVAVAPASPGFVYTPTAQSILSALAHAQNSTDFITVLGAPGIGKSEAACKYTRSSAHVTKIVGSPAMTSVMAVLKKLCMVLRQPFVGQKQMLLDNIVSHLAGKRALIIVDEAQFLGTPEIEILRAIHDQARIGVALIGNPRMDGRLSGEGANGLNAQISRRVGLRLKPKATLADIDALIAAWGIEDGPEKKLLRVIGKKPGALGTIDKVMRQAHFIAAHEGKAITAELIRDAFTYLDGTLAPGEAA